MSTRNVQGVFVNKISEYYRFTVGQKTIDRTVLAYDQ